MSVATKASVSDTEPAKTHGIVRTFGFAAILTVIIWAAVGVIDGFSAVVTVAILTVLEVTFSFDNAVVNAKVLKTMSPFWQTIFMTVGIFVAVFVVRFALPIFIVQLTSGLGFGDVVQTALNNPTLYAAELTKAGPAIEAFGGSFLLMIAVSYFMDEEKDVHWLAPLERRLAPLGKFDNITVFVMLVLASVLFFTVDEAERTTVLVASVLGIALHMGLDLFGAMFEKEDDEDDESMPVTDKVKVGMAAFAAFLYLEVLDASFSFDGVIGAFAITSSVLLIMAGLGAGAIWVRSMTVHLVRAGTLAKYRFLEHGAHWAILFLGVVMIVKLFHTEPPEWATGSIGVVFIALAVVTSIIARRREERELLA